MGTYNFLRALVPCPRCGVEIETIINCYFGYTSEMADLKIGDNYPWSEGVEPQNGGRPDGGNIDGEGYLECSICRKDAFMRVLVRGDLIVGVESDAENPGYILD